MEQSCGICGFEMLKAWLEEQLSHWIELQNGSAFKAGCGAAADVLMVSIPTQSSEVLGYRSERCSEAGGFESVFWLGTKAELHRDESWRGKQQLLIRLRQRLARDNFAGVSSIKHQRCCVQSPKSQLV